MTATTEQRTTEPVYPPRRGVRRFLGRHKPLAILGLLVAILAAVTGTWILSLNKQLDDIPRFELGLEPEGRERVARVPGEALNILLVGVDRGDGSRVGDMVRSGSWIPGTFRSDTMMVWHLAADRRESQVVSLPRDSWVEIPGRGKAKLNAALSYGGPELLVRTLEKTFGVYIDHVAVIDFEGFQDVTDTLGGVDVTMIDGTTEKLSGAEALAYVRARKTLPEGDFDRIDRQQNFLRAILSGVMARETALNPVRVTGLAGDLSGLAVLDSNFTNGLLRGLALDLARNRGGRITWLTAPYEGTGMVEGQSVVHLDVPETRRLFEAISDGRFEEYRNENPVELLPAPGAVD